MAKSQMAGMSGNMGSRTPAARGPGNTSGKSGKASGFGPVHLPTNPKNKPSKGKGTQGGKSSRAHGTTLPSARGKKMTKATTHGNTKTPPNKRTPTRKTNASVPGKYKSGGRG